MKVLEPSQKDMNKKIIITQLTAILNWILKRVDKVTGMEVADSFRNITNLVEGLKE